jgi:cell division ATPase FtsA
MKTVFSSYIFLNRKIATLILINFDGFCIYSKQVSLNCFTNNMSILNVKDFKYTIHNLIQDAELNAQTILSDFILVLDDCRSEFKIIEVEKQFQSERKINKSDISKIEQKVKDISKTEDFEIFIVKPSYVSLNENSLHFYIPYQNSCKSFSMGMMMIGFDSVTFNNIKYILNECNINITKVLNSLTLTALSILNYTEDIDLNSWKSVLYVGDNFSSILVFRGDCFCFVETIDVGFSNVLEQISQYLDIQYGDAQDVFNVAVSFNQRMHSENLFYNDIDKQLESNFDNKTLYDVYGIIQSNILSIINSCVANINIANNNVLKKTLFDVILCSESSFVLTPVELIKLDNVTVTLKCFNYPFFFNEIINEPYCNLYKKNDLKMMCQNSFLNSLNQNQLKKMTFKFKNVIQKLAS